MENNEILKAVFKVQTEVRTLKKNAENPFTHSKYATLEEVWDALRPLLRESKLLVIQVPTTEDDSVSLQTILYHVETGEKLEFAPFKLVLTKTDPQGVGSAITYARRYTLASIFGLTAEEDDDANRTVEKPVEKPQTKQEPAKTGKSRSREILEKLPKLFPDPEGKIDYALWGYFLKRAGKKFSGTKIINLTDEEQDWMLAYLELLEFIQKSGSKTKEQMDSALDALEQIHGKELYDDPRSAIR